MRGRLIVFLALGSCAATIFGALPTYKASAYIPPHPIPPTSIPNSGDLQNYSTTFYAVQHGVPPTHKASFGVPDSHFIVQVVPGVYRADRGETGGNGFVYQGRYRTYESELGWRWTRSHGSSPDGYITGSNYWSDGDGGGGSYGFGYNPITKHSFQVELGKFTQCRGGNSKGQFIFETDGFDDDYFGGDAVMYDSNTNEFFSLGGRYRPHTILDDGTVFGSYGSIYRWTKEKGREEFYDPRMNLVVIENVTQAGRVFGFGLGPGGGTSGDAGAFIFEDGKISKLIDLVPGFNASLLEIGGGHQTPEGVIFVDAYNKVTRENKVYRLDPVPEPASLLVLGLGVAALQRRRRMSPR